MKRHTFARLAFALCAAVALMLTGCGGDDNGAEQDLRDMLMAEEENSAMLQTQLDTANANVKKYMDMVTGLETTLGDEMDPAADSVRGMLAAAQADVDEVHGHGHRA